MFTQEKENKILKCQGCDFCCEVSAVEKKYTRPNGVEITQYIPVIGTKTIETYISETGAHMRPVLDYRADAIKTALEICRLCDRYKTRQGNQMADNKKVAKCVGCFHSCEITARELKLGSDGVMVKYFPKIGSNVIMGYTGATGKEIRAEFSCPIDAIVFAKEVLCKSCDRYRAR